GELEPFEGLAERRVVAALGRVQAAPHHGLGLAVAGPWLNGPRLAGQRDGVADLGLAEVLHPGHQVADLAGPELRYRRRPRSQDAGLLALDLGPGGHEPNLRTRPQLAVEHPDV